MGFAEFEANPVFRDRLFTVDRLVRRMAGVNLIETIFGPDDHWLNDISVTHPAIFAQQWAAAESLTANGVKADACLGASLGEFVALSYTGSTSLEACLKSIIGQAQSAIHKLQPGGMMTALVSANFFRANPHLFKDCTLAADNFNKHIVISGHRSAINTCRAALDAENISAFPLNIPFGFHSPAVSAIRSDVLNIARQLSFKTPSQPIYGCSLAGDTISSNAEHLWTIIQAPIMFSKTVKQIELDLDQPNYIDCSPSGTLATLLLYLLGENHSSRITALYSMAGVPTINTSIQHDAVATS